MPASRAIQVHMTLQGKGGVGKSVVSSIIGQNALRRGKPVLCLDADPVNATLCSFGALKAEAMDLLTDDRKNIERKKFDKLIMKIVDAETDVVVDNGASSFIPFTSYLAETEGFSLITGAGREVVVHCVLAGGDMLLQTLEGFNTLCRTLPPDVKLIVWLNEYQGPIAREGKSFEEMKVYETHRDKVTGIIRLAKQSADLVERDVKRLFEMGLTFDEARNSPAFDLMEKHRLAIVWRAIYTQLDLVLA